MAASSTHLINNHSQGRIEGYKLRVVVACNDDKGARIQNLQPGDIVKVVEASGIGSFAKSSLGQILKAVIGVTAIAIEGVVDVATEGEGVQANHSIESAANTLKGLCPPDQVKSKRRDAFGRDPGSGHYAKHEGGLVVFMPTSQGPIYGKEMRLKGGKNDGRKVGYYSHTARENNAFFPCRVDGGAMHAVVRTQGTAHILAFDSKYSDNQGYYEVVVHVIRAHAAGRHDSVSARF